LEPLEEMIALGLILDFAGRKEIEIGNNSTKPTWDGIDAKIAIAGDGRRWPLWNGWNLPVPDRGESAPRGIQPKKGERVRTSTRSKNN